MSQTHAVLRIRRNRNGNDEQNTLFIVNYNKDDIDFYYKTLQQLENLYRVEEDVKDDTEEVDEDEEEDELQELVNQNQNQEEEQGGLVQDAAPPLDGGVALAMAAGGVLGIYLLIFVLWLGRQLHLHGDRSEL